MRSGWPHPQDDQGMLPADQRHAPAGPGVSRSAGYSDVEYRDGDYRYTAPQEQPPAPAQGQHPYATFSGPGYGDDGYSDPGYQGPAAQDAGIAGTRTVRGFVDQGRAQAGYAQPGYFQGPDYPQSPDYQQGHGQSGYAGSSYAPAGDIEMAYPPNAQSAEEYHGADSYRQPWDYGQPLRYEDGVPHAAAQDGYQPRDGYQPGAGYQAAGDYRDSEYRGGYDARTGSEPANGYREPDYDPAAYNGSEYSRPGIDGAGYDLSGIIGTGDFEAFGYDEPRHDRLSYDDPRYEDTPRYGERRDSGPRSSAPPTWFEAPRQDDTRLDNLWLPGNDARPDATPGGRGHGGFAEGPVRSGYPALDLGAQGYRFDETRLDLNAGAVLDGSRTRFDMPAFDETRFDLRPGALLAPPAPQPPSWAGDTSVDHFAALDLTDEPAPAAFTRTPGRPKTGDTGARRAAGRRRGRSSDRRHWMALGAIVVVAAGTIGGVLMKYVFTGPAGPAHEVVAVNTVDGYTRSANLEKQMQVGLLAASVAKSSSGSASDVHSAVYQMGKVVPGGDAQIFMLVDGKLAGADPGSSVANFEAHYPGARAVSPGSLKGQASCTEAVLNKESVSMCVWFDNDTFGALVSSTMTTAKLAATMDSVRPSLELFAK